MTAVVHCWKYETLFAGWFHYHKAASCSKIGLVSRCRIYVESPFSGATRTGVSLLGGASQVHVSLPINQFLNAGVDPKEIPLPHESGSFGSTLSQFC
ncbi:hypothetical protein DCAR_0100160 [Daucus carota subsp. sativus]|uniref:Uncharacterized protein n=1 Tax=Daucus carota subsp. sativus TaxID=79200 RepID=A0AAF1AI75_DAUCS|nr:hypothetical protein DCAR_0100160 [Daucus carota subsp. sativus]